MNPHVRMLCSSISHMPLLFVWRDSGVTQQNGFTLSIDIAAMEVPGQDYIGPRDRAGKLLDGTYDFISGLHHEPYQYRARGDKRFVYLAQAQNDWDDRVVAVQEVKAATDLEGKRVLTTSSAPCVLGNLKHTLQIDGADLSRIDFVTMRDLGLRGRKLAVDAVARGLAAAAQIDAPFDLRGEKKGLHRLDVTSVPVIHNATMCANGVWVKENEETSLAFLRSMIDAIHFFKTEKQKVCEILDRTLAPLIGLEGWDEVEHLHEVWASLLSPKPYPHPIAVWNVYNLDVGRDPNVNFIGPFEIWNTSLLRAIDDSGYIDELYGTLRDTANPPVNVVI